MSNPTAETVWVCETGEYEQRYVVGVWRTLDDGLAGIKEMHASPYIVAWHDPSAGLPWSNDATTLVAEFSGRTEFFSFTEMEL